MFIRQIDFEMGCLLSKNKTQKKQSIFYSSKIFSKNNLSTVDKSILYSREKIELNSKSMEKHICKYVTIHSNI